MGNDRRRRGTIRWIFSITMSVVFFALSFAAAYGISVLIFDVTSFPHGIWRQIAVSMIGIVIFASCMSIFAHIHNKFHGNRRFGFNAGMLERTIDALSRISRGDFSVMIPVEDHDPFHEIAESVNRMAGELGTMESRRQDFISNVSHEIQSPLTSIRGFAALLKDDSLDAEKRKHYIDIIETESRRLSKLSENLMKLSSLESGGNELLKTEYRLDKQLSHVALMFEPQWMEKRINLDADLDKVMVCADGELMEQVWINLLNNAIKFTPEGGCIGIRLADEGGMAVCSIEDNGIGIAAEDRIHIFERFFKADKARERSLGGNGLGLSIVKKIIELHGGSVVFESEKGKGTVFTVCIPLGIRAAQTVP